MKTDRYPVVVKGLRVVFGKRRVLDKLDFELRRGSATALVGDNAAGKSTLLRVLIGRLVPDAGSVEVLGLDPARDGASLRARLGYVADRIELPNWMRAGDWLKFSARFYPTWNLNEQERLCTMLELDTREKVRELSKGNLAKLGLIAAMSHRPELLLFDEAFSGLDSGTREKFSSAVIDHLRDEGRTVLLVSHSIADIERVCDRVAILSEGRIAREDDLETIARTPRGGIDLDAALRREQTTLEVSA
ncbi:MAG TPA: ABC transporter ATP-binding protein [Planctomycetota bacterium]|nr:ABC transporter ATP-binding protein [Planctomycetota bacterium]